MYKLSIIVPVWNEEENIKPLVNRIHSALKSEGIEYEIIFIDDNSTDNSAKAIKYLANFFPISYHLKKGKKGKAYSLYEGFQKAEAETIAMIDADLQYPPEALVDMFKKVQQGADVVVAKRNKSKTSKIRNFLSGINNFVFGKVIFGIENDIQAGLKVFTKEVWQTVSFIPKSRWAFDLEFLFRARESGFVVEDLDIKFGKRSYGKSKVSIFKTSFELLFSSVTVFAKGFQPIFLPSTRINSMKGAGVFFNKQQYVTHTTLNHKSSAIKTITRGQHILFYLLFLFLILGLFFNPILAIQTCIGILTSVYFVDLIFGIFVTLKSMGRFSEIKNSATQLENIQDGLLPIYTILCPLYKEAHVIPQFVEAINSLDYPKRKLDVKLLLEEDDTETIESIKEMNLPSYFRIVVVPYSMPKTKPKACNYGLTQAIGEYVVIYDAEDIPDPLQLKKAFLAFQNLPDDVACLQAKLNYYNPHQNLLTKFFTIEYSLWFDVILTGLQSIKTTIPLGGTSNHFKMSILRKLEGWDPFNVTEDADLGTRLFKLGYKTEVIDSTTLEEANSNFFNWFRQRSRWIKGYLQTYLVHTRDTFTFIKNKGIHALIFQLLIGWRIGFFFLNPLLWIITISYFVLHNIVGPTIERFYPAPIFYFAITSLIVGNFFYFFSFMLGCARKKQWELIKYVYLVPIYWVMMSFAGIIAVYQLIFKPHYWEKTIHGFHLNNPITLIERTKIFISSNTSGTSILTGAYLIGNFLNYGYNAFLSRTVNADELSLLVLLGSFVNVLQIPSTALARTITHRSGILFGKYNAPLKTFWSKARSKAISFTWIAAFLWLIAVPFLKSFFQASQALPFLLFTPIIVIVIASSVDGGFLTGNFRFKTLATMVLAEATTKFVVTVALVALGIPTLAYIAIPISIFVSFVIGWTSILEMKQKKIENVETKDITYFPKKFFTASIVTRMSSAIFLSIDVILARHFLTPYEAGTYIILSLLGKIIYFSGSIPFVFFAPLISKAHGAKKDVLSIFSTLFFITAALVFSAYIGIGILGKFSAPILFGQKTLPIIGFLPFFGLSVVMYTLASAIVNFHELKHNFIFSYLSFLLLGVEVIGVTLFHKGIFDFVFVSFIATLSYFLTILILHLVYVRKYEQSVWLNMILDFFGLFKKPTEFTNENSQKLRVLILNWRDTRHVWAGGAEVYIQQISEEWVKKGISVTIFCGNDKKSARNEEINGVQIVRRGGAYSVYVWAFLYYLFVFKGHFDIIIDSENGIPFFSPLYSKTPKILLIHHIHQDVFRRYLKFPLRNIASFLESKLMPVVYSKEQIVTVSKSSKRDIESLGFKKSENIDIINPGIDVNLFYPSLKKTLTPTFLYLGRVQPYKNIDKIIKAFRALLTTDHQAKLIIAGTGESLDSLIALAKRLKISGSISFLGKVSDKKKVDLLSQSWAMLQPSSFEGWGITVIESNACATPVIASNVIGLRDSVIDGVTGILVDPKDIDGFTRAMRLVIHDNKLRKKLSNGAFSWAQKFKWETAAEDLRKTIFNTIFRQQGKVMIGKALTT